MKTDEKVELIANQYGLDINKVKGTGPDGKITQNDLETYMQENYIPKIKKEKKIFGIRKVIAERLSKSYREAVHVTLNMEVKMDAFTEFREKLSKRFQKKVSYTLLMLKPIAKSLSDFADLNAAIEENKIILYENININLAIESSNGLITPVVRDVDKKDFQHLITDYKDIIERSKNNQLKYKDFIGGTFTISNLGMFNVDSFNPIINPPQVAILGLNRIIKKAIVEDEEVKVAKIMVLSLTFDHRAVDGALAAEFLDRMREYFENPEKSFGIEGIKNE
jgi:pyruvate dehydrogenase E2 component (dihydrolipoamide acetyltransferase)